MKWCHIEAQSEKLDKLLQVEVTTDYLYEKYVLSYTELEMVHVPEYYPHRVKTLLSILAKKTEENHQMFLTCLEQTGQKDLLELIEKAAMEELQSSTCDQVKYSSSLL